MLDLLNEHNERKMIDEFLISHDIDNVAVEAIIFDNKGRWVLHKRGPSCRDEKYLLEGIGGRVEKGEEINCAINRELAEEIGGKVIIDILKIMSIRCNINEIGEKWGIISFLCYHRKGFFQIMEKRKNLGYYSMFIDDIKPAELSLSSQMIYSFILENRSRINEMLIEKIIIE